MNIVEFILNIKDGATHPLGKLSKAAALGKYSLDDLTKANEKLKGITDKTGNSIGSVRDKISKLHEMKELLPVTATKQIKEVNHEIEKLEKALERVENKKAEGGSGGLGGLTKLVPALAIGGSIVESINKGMESSKDKLNFEILVGKESGEKLYEGLKDMKALLGQGVFELGKELADSMDASKIIPTLTMLGNVAAGDEGKLAALTQQFRQLNKDGKLTEATLAGLEAGGFKPLVMIAETTGQSLARVRARFADGKISAAEVEKALKASTEQGGRFNGILNDLENSPTGKWNELIAKVSELTDWVGEQLMPAFMDLVNWLIDGFNYIRPALAAVVGALQGMFKWIKNNREVLEPLVTILGGFALGIWAVIAAKSAWVAITTAVTTGIEVMSAAIMSIPVFGWIVAAIAAVIAAVVWLRNNFEGFGKFFSNLWENLKAQFSMFVSYIKQGFEWLVYSFNSFHLHVKNIAEYIAGVFTNIGNAIKLATQFKFSEAKAALTATITTKASGQIDQLEREHQAKVEGYEKERADALAQMIAHPLSGIIKRIEKKEDAAEAATGGRGNKGTLIPDKTDLKNNGLKNDLNAVSGGGVKNITVTIGKMFDKVEFVIQNGTKQMAYELERIAEEAVTRAIASATAK